MPAPQMGDQRLKDELDFLETEMPADYPAGLSRPSLGCRTLVARVQHQVYPSVLGDLADWQPATRLMAGRLLYTMLHHVEQDAVQHTEKLFSCLARAAQDQESEVKSRLSGCTCVSAV